MKNAKENIVDVKLHEITGKKITVTTEIPKKSLDKIIDSIEVQDLMAMFDPEHLDHRREAFKQFNFSAEGDDYAVYLQIQVNYESLRGELVNDISFYVVWMTVYDDDGDVIILCPEQADKIGKAVKQKSEKA